MADNTTEKTPAPKRPKNSVFQTDELKLLLVQAFDCITSYSYARDRWMADVMLVKLIKNRYSIPEEETVTHNLLNSALKAYKPTIDVLDPQCNSTGIFMNQRKTMLPNELKRRSVCFYFITKIGGGPTGTPVGQSPAEWSAFGYSVLQTGSSNRHRNKITWDVVDKAIERKRLDTVRKRLSGQMEAAAAGDSSASGRGTSSTPCDVNTNPPKYWSFLQDESYFDSPEAHKLFRPKPTETVEQSLVRRINLLDDVLLDRSGGYKLVIAPCEDRPGDGGDPDNIYNLKQKEMIYTKCHYTRLSYATALEKMHGAIRWTWDDVTTQCIEELEKAGFGEIANGRTIQRWHQEFREHEWFRHTNLLLLTGQHSQPRTFQLFPSFGARLMSFATNNIGSFSTNLMQSHINEKLLPSLYEQWCSENREDGKEAMSLGVFYTEVLGLSNEEGVKRSTVTKWLQRLGYSYHAASKSYYVDGHERSDVVAARISFCDWYSSLELRCYRWVQLTKEQLDKLIERKELLAEEAAHVYDCSGAQMFEFHVDCSDLLSQFVSNETKDRGGNLSVRFPTGKKPVLISGQDECVVHQYARGRRQWHLPDGSKKLLPKSEGEGRMISAFNSRDYGFAVELTDELLQKINQKRRGTRYICEEAAQDIHSSIMKGDLVKEKNPTVVEFAVGNNNDGWWNYQQMCLQIEDVVDVLTCAYPHDEHVLLFDHSSCHDKKLEDGLSATSMNTGYGGSQPTMRKSKLTEGCVGMHSPIYSVGEEQSMVFDVDDWKTGPFWLTDEEKQRKMRDRQSTEPKKKSRTVLLNEFRTKSIQVPNQKFTIEQLRRFAEDNGVSIFGQGTVTEKGWFRQPKGLKQVLYERGLLDPSKNYTKYGRKDADDNLIPGTSLVQILAACPDFANERSFIEHLGDLLGVVVKSTPKYHAELAGEGIEYMWAVIKNWFKRLPIDERRTREKFRQKVAYALSREHCTLIRSRGSARRARCYIQAYLQLHEGEDIANTPAEAGSTGGQSKPFADIEELAQKLSRTGRKKYRKHRDVADTDTSYVEQMLQTR